jgi:hypothetical protein
VKTFLTSGHEKNDCWRCPLAPYGWATDCSQYREGGGLGAERARYPATPARNRAKWRYSAALNEFMPIFLNGAHRSVNRKVQVRIPVPEPIRHPASAPDIVVWSHTCRPRVSLVLGMPGEGPRTDSNDKQEPGKQHLVQSRLNEIGD